MKDFNKEIQEQIKAQNNENHKQVWYYLSLIGSTGIVFVFPILLGTYIGRYMDGHYQSGQISWTITGILLGVLAGIYNVYRFVYKRISN